MRKEVRKPCPGMEEVFEAAVNVQEHLEENLRKELESRQKQLDDVFNSCSYVEYVDEPDEVVDEEVSTDETETPEN